MTVVAEASGTGGGMMSMRSGVSLFVPMTLVAGVIGSHLVCQLVNRMALVK
tara:strand:+ start:405 stop:557 length:153 start_codon:yes stop_codon:yes gene_type:complete